jgi:hypothetical protein
LYFRCGYEYNAAIHYINVKNKHVSFPSNLKNHIRLVIDVKLDDESKNPIGQGFSNCGTPATVQLCTDLRTNRRIRNKKSPISAGT